MRCAAGLRPTGVDIALEKTEQNFESLVRYGVNRDSAQSSFKLSAESSPITNGSQDAQQRAAQSAFIVVIGKGMCGCPLC